MTRSDCRRDLLSTNGLFLQPGPDLLASLHSPSPRRARARRRRGFLVDRFSVSRLGFVSPLSSIAAAARPSRGWVSACSACGGQLSVQISLARSGAPNPIS
jgi:hypothetical protein